MKSAITICILTLRTAGRKSWEGGLFSSLLCNSRMTGELMISEIGKKMAAPFSDPALHFRALCAVQVRVSTTVDRRFAPTLYLARFQLTSNVAPDGVLGFMNFSSSGVREVMIFFCSPPPRRLANVLPSSFMVITFSASLTEYLPK